MNRFIDYFLSVNHLDIEEELGGVRMEDDPGKISAEEIIDFINNYIAFYTSVSGNNSISNVERLCINFRKVPYSPSSAYLDDLAKYLASLEVNVKVNSPFFNGICILFRYDSLKEEFLTYYNKYKTHVKNKNT